MAALPVPRQITRSSCFILAEAARIFHFLVNLVNVLTKVPRPRKLLLAMRTRVIPDFLVHRLNMLLQVAFLAEFLAAGRTLVLPDFGMDSLDVDIQFAFVTKFFTAGRAFELCSHLDLHIP